MNDEKRRILEMVADGRISQEDALRLLDALEEDTVDRAFGHAMAQLRDDDAPTQQAPPQPAEPQVPPQPQGSLWDEVEEAAREVGQALSQTAAVTMDAISEGMQWAKGAVQKIPGVTAWWDDGDGAQGDGQPVPYQHQNGGPAIEKLDIQWVNGPVEVVPWEGQWVNVTEYSKRPLEDGQQLELTVTDGGTMRIRWTREKGFWKGLRLSKYLLVQVPTGLRLEKVSVENVSGPVQVQGLTGEDISLGTTSGRIDALGLRVEKLKATSVSGLLHIENVQGERLELNTTSGRIEAPSFGAERAKLSTVSGQVRAYGNGESLSVKTVSGAILLQTELPPQQVKLESLSGRATLLLPENPGFTAKYESMSGGFSSEFPVGGELGGKSGKAIYANGGMQVSLHTLSGKIEICRAPSTQQGSGGA